MACANLAAWVGRDSEVEGAALVAHCDRDGGFGTRLRNLSLSTRRMEDLAHRNWLARVWTRHGGKIRHTCFNAVFLRRARTDSQRSPVGRLTGNADLRDWYCDAAMANSHHGNCLLLGYRRGDVAEFSREAPVSLRPLVRETSSASDRHARDDRNQRFDRRGGVGNGLRVFFGRAVTLTLG